MNGLELVQIAPIYFIVNLHGVLFKLNISIGTHFSEPFQALISLGLLPFPGPVHGKTIALPAC
jgi:hypothetical protein